jgi:quercetin dioxygenase-like cupin family protein
VRAAGIVPSSGRRPRAGGADHSPGRRGAAHREETYAMDVIHWKECEDKPIEKFPYKDKLLDVVGTSIRWLSRHGDDGHGYPEYGLRFFTIQPGGSIPIHNHFYHQTMFILSGEFECWQFDPQTDALKRQFTCGAGTAIYVPSLEPHGMRNVSDVPGTFLCCIANVYEDAA